MADKRQTLRTMRRECRRLEAESEIPYHVHHRHPRSRKDVYPGKHINEKENLEIMEALKHRSWHNIVANYLPKEIAKLLSDKYLPRDWYFIAMPRKRKKGSKRRTRTYCTDCSCEVLQHIPKKG